MVELILHGRPLVWKAPYVSSRGAFSTRTPIVGQIKSLLRQQYNGPLMRGYIAIDCVFCIQVPASASKKKRQAMLSGEIRPEGGGDRSNFLKFCEDYLEGVVYANDRMVVDGRCAKQYDTENQTIIRIYSIDEYEMWNGRAMAPYAPIISS